ncbi:GNAT family N-acetyltransferase [Nocardia sp. NEAU-G5]|uniref:GNAT family N-acetyltransferase n=1 Tax=Nocardia albiluteola TaxID=2842303 RepID=A0ABS6B1T9_9NOCA|nr:GNAT family N-acetyltransferase [Nocardia albiluteola]MBU3063193.1 GNAT family N-acetyltransferase [Nocardia albiluteola]
MTEIALDLPGIDRVEIHCGVTNSRSAAVARRAGFLLDRIGPRDKTAPQRLRPSNVLDQALTSTP